MGCLLFKDFCRNDEVAPIHSLSYKVKTENGTTPKYGVDVGATDRQTADSEPQKQVVLTSRSSASSSGPLQQNGSIGHKTNQEPVPSPRDAFLSNDDGRKHDAAIVTNHSEAAIVTSHKEAAIVTNQNDAGDSSHQDGADHVTSDVDDGSPAAVADVSSMSDEKAASNENDDANESDNIPADENDAAESTNPNPEAPPPFQMPEVEIQQVPDGEGSLITLGQLFGVWTVPWPSLPEQIMRAQFFTFHDSDVILTGYAKSGSHWVWEMVHMLMTGRAEHCRTPKERLMLSFSTQEFFDTLPPPRVFNTHAPFQGFPVALREGVNRCKMIYLLRNPKDLAVSYYHHLINQVDFQYEGSFHGYLDLFLEGKVPGGSWFDYVLGWEQTMKDNPHLPILVLHYEDVKQDTVAALRKLNEFLAVDRSPELLREIADMCTIKKMKAVQEQLKDQGPSHVNLSKTGKDFILRKGEVGDWQNWFSEEDDRRFLEAVDSRLRGSDLHFRYLLEDDVSQQQGGKEGEEEGEKEEEEEEGERGENEEE